MHALYVVIRLQEKENVNTSKSRTDPWRVIVKIYHMYQQSLGLVWFMVFNATFNNISVILWRSVLLFKDTKENHRPVASHWQTVSHNVVQLANERNSNSQLYRWKALIAHVVVIPTNIRSRPRRPLCTLILLRAMVFRSLKIPKE